MQEWKLVKTDRGTGMQCPREECGGKMVANVEELRADKTKVGHQVICPYCECLSKLPKP